MESNVQIGSIVKSYDFSKEQHPDYYIIGVVTEIKGDALHCDTAYQYSDGPVEKFDKTFIAYKQGASDMDDLYTRLVILI
jgi:hypothetical protein